MNRFARRLFASSAVLAAALGAQNAYAQSAPTADTAAASGTIGEVVVTAERTESTVQRTPLSVAVVTGDTLVQPGINTLSQHTNIEPTLAFTNGQFNGASVAVRGVSSSGGTAFGGSAVTINTDGQYLLRNFNGVLFDVGRIEVLKGPQGTLYGMNATAGAVNIITNAPTFRNSFDGTAEAGNYDYFRTELVGNYAISDQFAVRLAVLREKRDGFRSHPGMKASDLRDIFGARLSALWRPNERLSVRLTGEMVQDDLGNAANQGVPLVASAATPAGEAPRNVTYKTLGLDPYNWRLNYEGWNHNRPYVVRANASYDFGPATLTYVGSYMHMASAHCQPAFGSAALVTDHCSVQGDRDNFVETKQHELRLNGSTSFGTKWQGGVFYSRFRLSSFVNIYNPVTASAGVHVVPFIYFREPANVAVNKAIYGQITQNLTEKLSVTGGLRHTKVDQEARDATTDTIVVPLFASSGGAIRQYTRVNNSGGVEYSKTTWKLGVDYQATSRNLIYANVSTSFKDGGFTQTNAYDPEDMTAYEVGTKNRFFDNRVQLNAAAYHYDYKNQQAQVFVLQPTGLATLTTVNAGSSRITGAEANAIWQVNANDRLQASATYADAKYVTFNVAQPIIPLNGVTAVNRNLVGNRPPQAPRWTLTAGWDHTFDLGALSLTSSINTRYVTNYYLSVFNLAGDKVKGFMQTDASLTLASNNDRWDITAFVRNLEDNTTLGSGQYLVQGGANIYMFSWLAPRTYGARLGVHF